MPGTSDIPSPPPPGPQRPHAGAAHCTPKSTRRHRRPASSQPADDPRTARLALPASGQSPSAAIDACARADRGHHAPDREPFTCRPRRDPGNLPVKIRPLVRGGDAGLCSGKPRRNRNRNRNSAHQDQPARTPRRNRQPPSRNHWYPVTAWAPRCRARSFKFTHAFCYTLNGQQQLTSPTPITMHLPSHRRARFPARTFPACTFRRALSRRARSAALDDHPVIVRGASFLHAQLGNALRAATGPARTQPRTAAPAGRLQPGQPRRIRQQLGRAAIARDRDDGPDPAARQSKPLPRPICGGPAWHRTHDPILPAAEAGPFLAPAAGTSTPSAGQEPEGLFGGEHPHDSGVDFATEARGVPGSGENGFVHRHRRNDKS